MRLAGLYVITPERPAATVPLVEQVALAIAGGAALVQYREKSGDPRTRLAEARGLLAACRARGVPLIINDDLELAAAVGAHGVHLGRDDADPREARSRLGPGAIIGVSCYDQLGRAEWAEAVGADYAAFGRFFLSATKPHAVQAEVTLLQRARRELHLPLVAIGGITPENGAPLVAAGAHMLAVVEAVFGRPDIRAAARAFVPLFSPKPADGGPDS
jgi:thiamine-phosphate pyrophosphorylase